MIQAIIFDCFGVLTTDGWHPFKAKYFGHDRVKAVEAGKLNVLANSGQIEYQQFLHQIGELAGLSAQQVDFEISRNIANDELFGLIEQLAQTYKIGMLSNAADNWLKELFAEKQLALFDVAILSCDIGVNKPSPDAYYITADALEVPAENCLFVDDLSSYIRGAEQAGMQAIQYKNYMQFKQELDALLKSDQSE